MVLDQSQMSKEIIEHQYQVDLRKAIFNQQHQIQALQKELQELKSTEKAKAEEK